MRQFSRLGEADAERIHREWMHLEEMPIPRKDTARVQQPEAS